MWPNRITGRSFGRWSPGSSTCVKKPAWTKLIVWRSPVRLPCTAAKSHRGHRVTSMSIRKLLGPAGCFASFLKSNCFRHGIVGAIGAEGIRSVQRDSSGQVFRMPSIGRDASCTIGSKICLLLRATKVFFESF